MSSASKPKTDTTKAKQTGPAKGSDKPETTNEGAPNGVETGKTADETADKPTDETTEEADLTDADTAGLTTIDAEDEPLCQDGPTLEEYVAAGYPADRYPPKGYAKRTTSCRQIASLTEAVQAAARAAHLSGDQPAYAALQHFEIALGEFKRSAKTAAAALPPDTQLSVFLSHGVAGL